MTEIPDSAYPGEPFLTKDSSGSLVPFEDAAFMSQEMRDLFLLLDEKRLRFLYYRLQCKTDTEACDVMGVKWNTFYQWKMRDRNFEKALKLIFIKPVETSISVLERAAGKAAMVLIAELDNEDSAHIRLKAANSILDRIGVKGPQVLELRRTVQIEHSISDDELIQRAGAIVEQYADVIDAEYDEVDDDDGDEE